jgi:hypothetical protein
MVEEVSFGRLTPGNSYILVERGSEDMPSGGVFESYAKSGRHWTAVFNQVENLDDENPRDSNGIMFDPRRTRFFRDLSRVVRSTTKKAIDQAIRDRYEKASRDPSRVDEYGKPMTQSSEFGRGPADVIRAFVGIQPRKGLMRVRTLKHVGRGRKTRRRHK